MTDGIRPAEATRGFESVFGQILLRSLRASVPRSDASGRGAAQELRTDLLDQHLAELAARRAPGLGLTEAFFRPR